MKKKQKHFLIFLTSSLLVCARLPHLGVIFRVIVHKSRHVQSEWTVRNHYTLTAMSVKSQNDRPKIMDPKKLEKSKNGDDSWRLFRK